MTVATPTRYFVNVSDININKMKRFQAHVDAYGYLMCGLLNSL